MGKNDQVSDIDFLKKNLHLKIIFLRQLKSKNKQQENIFVLYNSVYNFQGPLKIVNKKKRPKPL